MKAKDIHLLILAVIAFVFYVLWNNEKEQRIKQEEINRLLYKEIDGIKQSYLSLLIAFMVDKASAKPDTIAELEALKGELDELDKDNHLEIDSVIRHVNLKEYSKALRDLAKIVENKLKEQVEKDETFNGKHKTLANMLKHAFSCKWISEQDYHNGLNLKDIRNEESHELGVKVSSLEAGLSVLAGIKLVYVLGKRK
jgi:hypothetical protein